MSRFSPRPAPARAPSGSLAVLLVLAACGGEPAPATDATLYEGARLIVGDGTVLDNAAFVVEDGRFTLVGPAGAVDVPAGTPRIDLAGKTVMPALVNAHVHLPTDRAERATLLQHMAWYGAGMAVSLGLDDGDVGYVMRDEVVPDGARSLTAGRGITSPEPGRTEVPYWVTSEEEARAAVRELAPLRPDFVKIWVDDRGGQYERLSEPLYTAVIDEAHAQGLRVIAHVFSLEDGKGLLRAGIDAFAHGIRDQDVDDELVALWQERPNVVLVPNLPDPGVAQDLSWLSGTVPAAELERMQANATDRPQAQASFGIQARNLVRLHQAGIPIAFGTDGSSPWAVHQELEDMVRAGMPAADVLAAATGGAAALLQRTDIGVIESGRSADFLVLDGDPTADITHTRRIDSVYLRGTAVDRDALAARLKGAAAQ